MATKPATVPSIWAPGAVYTTGPFVGLANKVPVAGAVAIDGHRPGAADPTPAEYVNDQDNKTTTWIVDWLSQGDTVAAANTHIMETDAFGRHECVGLDMTDPVDETVCTIVGANTAAPAVLVQTPGNGIQVESTGLGTLSFVADMTGGSCFGYGALDTAPDAAVAFAITMAGNTGGLGTITSSGTGASGLDVSLTASPNDTMVLANGGGGAPVRLTPQVPPGGLIAGQIWPDSLNNDFEGVRPSGVATRFWSSEQGYNYTFSELAVAAAAGASYISFNYGFVLGKTYVIRYGFDFGRTVGSTRHAIDFFNIGGFILPTWFGAQLDLFQGGAAQIEKSRMKEFSFVSPVTAILLVDLFVGSTAGAGTVQIENGFLSVLGALD